MTKPLVPQSWIDHDAKVRPYVRWHRLFSSFRTLLLVVLTWALLESQRLVEFESGLTEMGFGGFALFALFFGALAAGWEVASFPLSFAHYQIDRHFGVSRQTPSAWLLDHVKGLVVGSALGLLILTVTWYCIAGLGSQWWLALACFFLVFSVVLAQLAPVLLVPLFFKMQPLPDGDLRNRLVEMSSRFKVSVKEIFLLGLGEKTEKGNAAFMGLGKTKRIAIGDTIYQKYPAEQVLAVFAHELGHLVHKDIWKGLALSSVFLFLTFGLANWICATWVLPRWFTWIEAPFGLFLFLVVVSLVSIPLGFIERLYSRWRERKADEFAARRMQMAAPLADALEALTLQNRAYFVPHPAREFFLFSHPAPWRRISGLRSNS